ncbi:hypothetical protein FA13DRAFT_1705674 [Coprinellus micaceus]|uniref:YCII-related domain-containing protein n=1 Tax=Coprinellus micaceus TaxID=71717 RepID=A0A4Y7TTH4_COPMI|nr:hypothetical protein FA13DRAFT_1705674 [Coprinellus micaceus]
MSSQARPTPKYFFVYAPDKTEAGTFERRMSVRPKHLETAHERTGQGLIRMLDTVVNSVHAALTIPPPSLVLEAACSTPESIASPDAPKKLIGSTFIYQAESLEEVKKLVESDVYYQSGVWDPEKIVITPFAPATPLP